MTSPGSGRPVGRGSHVNPANRFAKLHLEPDLEHLEYDDEASAERQNVRTEYLSDQSQSIVTENDSPDIPFRYSLNPYRGCAHGCSYCYARPTHEYLGFSAGLDFETKILVKAQAPELFREFLTRPSWQPEPIILSGVTDPYQSAERQFRLTRQCLEVALEARQPIAIVTKNALVLRDLDLLREMATLHTVRVTFSVTSLEQSLSRVMEPRTSAPEARLRAMRGLTDAGVPVQVLVAPVIPGLNDKEIPAILGASAQARARAAYFQLVRLPLSVKPVFLEWLERTHPLQKERIENLIRSTREGELNSSEFGKRMSGTGAIAEQIEQLFHTFAHKHGLDGHVSPLDCDQFRAPAARTGQLRLF